MMRSVNEENVEENRKVQVVKSAFNTLSFSELEAIIHIFDELNGDEGILVASKIADRVGITRSVIVNALRKFESAGVIESRSSGMKGTYIKVLNDYIFDELDEIKARKNLKGKGDAHPDEAKKIKKVECRKESEPFKNGAVSFCAKKHSWSGKKWYHSRF